MQTDPTYPGGILVRRLIEMIPFALVVGVVVYYRVGTIEASMATMAAQLKASEANITEISSQLKIFNAYVTQSQQSLQSFIGQEHRSYERTMQNNSDKINKLEKELAAIEKVIVELQVSMKSRISGVR